MDTPLHLYDVFSSREEAQRVAKEIAKRFQIFTTVDDRSVFLLEEHRRSTRFSGFAAAWEEGEKRRGTWSHGEVDNFRDKRGSFERDKEKEYSRSQDETYRDALWDAACDDPPYKQREP